MQFRATSQNNGHVELPNQLGSFVLDPIGIPGRIRRHKALFAVSALATGLLVAGVFFLLPTKFIATAAVTVSVPEPVFDNGNSLGVIAEKLGDEADLQTQILVINPPGYLAWPVPIHPKRRISAGSVSANTPSHP